MAIVEITPDPVDICKNCEYFEETTCSEHGDCYYYGLVSINDTCEDFTKHEE